MKRKNKMNLPNKLTLMRIAAIPVIIVLMLLENKVAWFRYVALLMFILASLTDMLDGKIARKNNMVTDFGKLMDPLADKALVVSVLILLVEQGRLSAIPVILIVVREFAVTSLRAIAAASPDQKVIAASMWGKLKTVTQMITIIMIMLDNIVALIPLPLIPIMVILTVIMTVVSGAEYFIRYKDFLKDC